MIELEKKYLPSGLKKKADYLNQIIGSGASFDQAVYYSLKKKSLGIQANTILLDSQEKDLFDLSAKNSLVKFLFCIYKYNSAIFSRHKASILEKSNLKNRILKIKKNIHNGDFLAGCILKQVKGGFTVDLEGLICFMPYSLSEGTRLLPYEPKVNSIQLFQAFGFSLVSMKEQELFLNVILSRKQNTKTLKSFLKKKLQNKVFDKNIRFFTNKKFNCLRNRNIKLRLIGKLVHKKNQGDLKMIKEIFIT